MKDTEDKLFNGEETEVIVIYPDQEENNITNDAFWYKDNDETKINREQFLWFLEKRGFRKLYIGKEYLFVHVENNIVKEVSTVHIKDYVANYIKGLGEELEGEFNSRVIWGKVINQVSTLFCKNFLELIPNLEEEFKRDTKDISYMYYQNYFVKVAADECTVYKYEELERIIWKKQIINKDFHISNKESDFKKFISRICRDDENRFNTLRSVIGYLLHSYKDPANAKAIIFMDEKIDDGSNGGCGKSLLGNAISQIRKSLRLGGKGFKFDRFSFQSYEPGTNIIEFNDLRKSFPFEMLFTAITDNIAIEKKNKDELIVPFEYSPKILLSTNHTIKGVDESTLRRQFIVEFSDFFSMRHTPEDEYRRRFFDDWNDNDWNSFFNFMIGCLQYYLKNGLVEYERINLGEKMLVESTSEEFVEFMEEIEMDTRYNKKELHQKFIEIYPDYKDLHQKTITGWIKVYAKLKGLKYEDKKSGAERSFTLTEIEDGRMDEWTNRNKI